MIKRDPIRISIISDHGQNASRLLFKDPDAFLLADLLFEAPHSSEHKYLLFEKSHHSSTAVEKYLNWPRRQHEDYFGRFGKEAVIVSPPECIESLKIFYGKTLNAYRKAGSE